MPTISEIRAGIAANLAAVQDGEGKPQVDAYAIGNPPVPSIRVLRPEDITYDIAGSGGGDSYIFVVQLLFSLTDDVSAQQNLDLMLSRDGAQSVKAAIEADDSLGGTVDQVWVKSSSGYREYDVGGVRVLGAEFTVQVETSY